MQHSRRKYSRSYLLAFIGVALFATVEVAVKDSTQELGYVFPVFQFVTVRFLTTGILFIAISFFNPAIRNKFPQKEDLFKIITRGILAAPVAIGLFQYALSFESLKASSGAALFSVNPIFVAIIATSVLGEKLNLREWFGLILGFCGAFLISFPQDTAGGWSLLVSGSIMVASGFFFALYIVTSKQMVKKYGGLCYTGWTFFCGGVAAALIALVFEGVPRISFLRSPRAAFDILWVIFAGTALAYYCYLVGLSKVKVAKGSYLFFAKPFLALIFAQVYLSEKMFTVSEWIGFLMIVSGLFAVIVTKKGNTLGKKTA